jgi:hypothetical protein
MVIYYILNDKRSIGEINTGGWEQKDLMMWCVGKSQT